MNTLRKLTRYEGIPDLLFEAKEFYHRIPSQNHAPYHYVATNLRGHQRAAHIRKPGEQMNPYRSNHRAEATRNIVLKLSTVLLLALTWLSAPAQDLTPGLTYVCNGERMFIENCNMRDLSDTANCMVGHPDHIMPNGLMQYTNMTRGALKQLFPTCKQPSAQEIAKAQAFQKRQQDAYNANVAKANQQMQAATAPAQPGSYGQPAPPKTPEEREMRRCVSSGRLPASCTGNSLLGAFGQMISQVLPGADKAPHPGPNMAGVFQGPGSWRLDFIDGGVLVNCSFLSPNQENYTIDFKGGRTLIVIDTTPKPLVLTFRADGTIVGPGPVTIDGVVAGGSSGGGSTPGHTETHSVTSTERINAYQVPAHSGDTLTNTGGGTYDATHTTTTSTYVPGTYTAPQTTFSHRRATCPALNLSTKGAGVGVQTMQTDLLKTMFGGDKGPPTPPGIRMHGIFAAPTGFSVEFFPESAILGCGPDAARAYPYTVHADGSQATMKIDAPDHPLTLAFMPNGSLDPGGSGPYQVHGRIVTGQDNNDDFTFAPMEQTCNLAVLTPSKTIPSGGGTAATMAASAGNRAAATPGTSAYNGGGTLSVPGATLGNATLSIVSGFPPQPGVPNPLAGHPYTLLRDSFATILAKGGITVPPGTSPYKVLGNACGNHTPDCQKIMDAIKASAASAVRADANGSGTFPGVPPGTYYLMISTRYNNQALVWGQPVQLKTGPNSVTLDLHNAAPVN
jgi:hypothetical protein